MDKIKVKVDVQDLLNWLYDNRDGKADLANDVISKLGGGKVFSIYDIKPGFIPSNFILNPEEIDATDREEVIDNSFEFFLDKHSDKYQIEWNFPDGKKSPSLAKGGGKNG